MTFKTSNLHTYIDLGTANTRIFNKKDGLIINEPSMLLLHKNVSSNKLEIITHGKNAKIMLGRTSSNSSIMQPLEKGVISNFEFAEKMLDIFLKKHNFVFPRRFYQLLISLPCCVTEFEKNAIREIGYSLGFRKVHVINELAMGLIGEGRDICGLKPYMIVDIGDGIIEVAIISHAKVVCANAIRIGGQQITHEIINFLKQKYNFLIGEQRAEYLKINTFAMNTGNNSNTLQMLKGKDLSRGIPCIIQINKNEIALAADNLTQLVVKLIKITLEDVSEQIFSDIINDGIILTGGGAFIRNIHEKISSSLNLKVNLPTDPLLSVVKGGSFLLHHPSLVEKIAEG